MFIAGARLVLPLSVYAKEMALGTNPWSKQGHLGKV